jgi:ribosome-associated protein
MSENVLEITPDLRLPVGELTFRATRSGGPGGQHVNTSSTRVELVWDLENSPSLTADQRERIRTRLATRISSEGLLILASSATRSQHRNRQEVTERFAEMLRGALHIPRARRKTKPSRAEREKRLRSKKRRSETKRLRRPPSVD